MLVRFSRTRPSFETLEPRYFLAVGCNPFNELDVDDDGFVAARDALIVINELNGASENAGEPDSVGGLEYSDVNDDGLTSPIDALLIINHLNGVEGTPLPLVFALAPSDDPDGNGVVLIPHVTVQGQTTPGSRVRLKSPSFTQETLADTEGRFYFALELNPGATSVRVDVVDRLRKATSLQGDIRFGDVILDWNATLLNVVRDWTTFSNDPYPDRIVPSQPPRVARNLAMVHAAMFDAVNAITGDYEPYHVHTAGSPDASPIAAAAAAAHRVASGIYREEDELAIFDAALLEALAIVPDGPEESQGLVLGQAVGDAILAWRTSDGAGAAVPYVPGSQPGDWNRTFPDFYPPLLPQWPGVTPFALTSPAQFRPAPPPDLASDEYAAAVQEVMRLGDTSSGERTREQTEVALFWADGGGTFTPPGHWNQIAADVVVNRDMRLDETARLFALLNIALADAGITSWDAKYQFGLWRPIDAIREADLDDNAATVPDREWTPLLRTPPFPTYTSGHSTFSGAAATVLNDILGEQVAFVSEADRHRGFTQRPLNRDQFLRRSFISFDQAAEEAGQSRIYGGIHFQFDNTAGLESGRQVGNYVVAHLIRPRI